MKWVSHVVLTGTVAYAVTSDPLPAAAACVGAVLPDKIEGTGAYFFYDAAFFSALTWLLLGALCHIAEDAVCGKVPALFPTQKIGIRLFTVGSLREYLFVLFCIVVVYAAQYIIRSYN